MQTMSVGEVAPRMEVSPALLSRGGLLRFNTCGSVDDGKSTLIGRLLVESGALFEDQLESLKSDSLRIGTRRKDIDYALVMDGLAAEREQGITIDVAYRFFSTGKRSFIIADTPGHEQYTRNMVTGASTADFSVILVDASKGVLVQTRRHSFLVGLLGIEHVLLAVNKMDLVGYSESTFREIEREYRTLAEHIGIQNVTCIPMAAVNGDNVVRRSKATRWYNGPTMVEFLDSFDRRRPAWREPFRFPVQWVNRPSAEFRGFSGTIVSGNLRRGDLVRVLPSGRTTQVTSIVLPDGIRERATAGHSVTLTLADEVDVSRGDVMTSADSPAQVADEIEAKVVWMSEVPLHPERDYLIKIGTKTARARVKNVMCRIDVSSFEMVEASVLGLNDIGVCEIGIDRMVAFDSYATSREMGGFILIDKISNDTVAAGMVIGACRKADNIHWHSLEVDQAARSAMKHQRSRLLWYTGLSAAGKSTIANLVDKRLHSMGRHTYLLDGDNLRHGLNKDLGFSDGDRVENIRRVAEVGRLMVDAGLIVGAAFISPFRAERRMARALLPPGQFIEIFVHAPLEVVEQRDPKGLYRKARLGEVKNFTGIDSPYEVPESPELTIDTAKTSPAEAVEQIIEYLRIADAVPCGDR